MASDPPEKGGIHENREEQTNLNKDEARNQAEDQIENRGTNRCDKPP